MNERIGLVIDAVNNTEQEFNQVIRDLRQVDQVSDEGSQKRIANIRRERQENQQKSTDAITNINRERSADQTAHRQSITESRTLQQFESARSRDRLSNINTESTRQRAAAQENIRSISRQRLAERRWSRESQRRYSQIRRDQASVNQGFGAWATSLSGIGTILGGSLLYGLQRFGSQVLEVTKNFEQIRLGMAALEGSPLIADRQLASLRQLARLPGVEYEGSARATAQLRASGLSFEQSERLIREISNMAAIAGRSAADTSRVLYFLQQSIGIQQFRTEEVKEILEILPQMRGLFEETFGSALGERIQAAMEAGGVSFSEGLDELLTRAEAGPRASADTITNSIDNLRDNWADLMRGFGEDFTPQIKTIVDSLSKLVEWANENRGLVTAIAAVTTAVVALKTVGGVVRAARTAREIARTNRVSRITQSAEVATAAGQGLRYFGGTGFSAGQDVGGVTIREGWSRGQQLVEIARHQNTLSGFGQLNRSQMVDYFRGKDVGSLVSPFGGDTFSRMEASRLASLAKGGRFAPAGRFVRGAAPAIGSIVLIEGAAYGVEKLLEEGTEIKPETERITNEIAVKTAIDLEDAQKQLKIIFEYLNRVQAMKIQFEKTGKINKKDYEELVGTVVGPTRVDVGSIKRDPNRALKLIPGLLDKEGKLFSDIIDRATKGDVAKIIELQAQIDQVHLKEDNYQYFTKDGVPQLKQSAKDQIKNLEIQKRALIDSVRAFRDLYIQYNTAYKQLREPEGFGPLKPVVPPNIGVSSPFGVSRPPRRNLYRDRGPIEYIPRVRTITPTVPPSQVPLIPTDPILPYHELGQNRAGGLVPLFPSRTGPSFSKNDKERRDLMARGIASFGAYDPSLDGKDIIADLYEPEPRGLLEPRRLEAVTSEINKQLEAWKELKAQSDSALRNIGDTRFTEAEVFSRSSIRTFEDRRKELNDSLQTLLRLGVELQGLENVPEELSASLARGAKRLREEIERLDSVTKAAREYLHDQRYSGFLEREKYLGLTEEEFKATVGKDAYESTVGQRMFGNRGRPPTREELMKDLKRIGFIKDPTASDTAVAIQQHIARSGESLYDQFIAPSILDAVGIGSGRSQARDRALQDLQRSLKESREQILQDTVLNAKQQSEELLELTREYEREKREIERQYEEERSDAWANWVRQQLTDIPKLIFEQLKLQLSARATNEILNALGIGGGRIPIQGGGLLDRIGGLFGGGGGGTAAIPSQYTAPIGPGLSGAQTVGGASAAGTAATAGTVLSAALAAHNIGTAIVPQWNPHGTSAYDIVGEDLASIIVDPARSFFESFHFNNPMNDNYAFQLGRERAIIGLQDLTTTAARYGRESAVDLANNYDKGMAQGEEGSSVGNQSQGNFYMVPENAEVKIVNTINDREVREITIKMGDMFSAHRLSNPFKPNSYGG